MKKRNYVLVILITLFSVIVAKAQESANLEDMYLKGKWHAKCPIAIRNRTAIEHCELCNFIIDPNDRSMASVSELDLTFKEDSIVISQSGNEVTVGYSRNKDNHAIDFDYMEKHFHFSIFYNGEERILVDKDGMVAILVKVK